MTTQAVYGIAGRRLAAALGLVVLVFLPSPASLAAANFIIEDASIGVREGSYRLDARINYRFNDTALEALRNGVPLTVEVRVEVYRLRPVLWDERVTHLRLRHQLRYRALSQLYQVIDLDNRSQRNFASITAALQALGTLRNLPVMEAGTLAQGEQFYVRLRADLDIEALPLPLRPLAYVSPSWHLASEWYRWPPGS